MVNHPRYRATFPYKVYAIKNVIVVDGLTKNSVSVFVVDSSLAEKRPLASGKVEFKVKKVVYRKVIEGKVIKIIVSLCENKKRKGI